MVMTQRATGNPLDARTDTIVIPVTLEGVLRAGLGKLCMQRFPSVQLAYRQARLDMTLTKGRVVPCPTGAQAPQRVILFPTRRRPSDSVYLSWVLEALPALVEVLKDPPTGSVAVPALGCSLGGLSYTRVLPHLTRALSELDDIVVRLFPPQAQRVLCAK